MGSKARSRPISKWFNSITLAMRTKLLNRRLELGYSAKYNAWIVKGKTLTVEDTIYEDHIILSSEAMDALVHMHTQMKAKIQQQENN